TQLRGCRAKLLGQGRDFGDCFGFGDVHCAPARAQSAMILARRPFIGMRTDIRREIFTSSEAGSVSFAIGRSVRLRMACLASRLMRCRISVVDTPAPLS